ncbi:hypothetical protein Rsub_04173 [Raphidocelis subcapitata]|uniref:Complex 1 LYR protein domain-containing protein n=1 Tax=Raphidocelis subcapitata TaxID=307507 RepID=A0A2V0P0R4_9CHLO|nr:hypothetical protein Rsub_04173 [Raphidocelis subcapitata]|eukprot:GBF91433.1 hypothetical protein Rsub_04173 [Raphidocelis subcapitata]
MALRALALYRQLLREARKMPTDNRRRFLRRRAREGFEAGRAATGDEAAQLLILAETQLESAAVQRRLLCELFETGNLKGPKDPRDTTTQAPRRPL